MVNSNSLINQVELTEDDIYEAKWRKFLILEKEQKDKEREEFKKQVAEPWTAKEMFHVVEARMVEQYGFSTNEGLDGKPVFEMDDKNIHIIQALCYYFTNDKKFETMGEGWSIHKGICVMGNVGRGKSLLMRLFANNKRQCYQVTSCRTVASDFASNGHEVLSHYSQASPSRGDYRTFYQRNLGTCFDDLGTEDVKKNYGNELNVMSEVLLNRYDGKDKFPFDCTHITTNLEPGDIERMYGTRVRSRFKEMFNVIILNGDDRRK